MKKILALSVCFVVSACSFSDEPYTSTYAQSDLMAPPQNYSDPFVPAPQQAIQQAPVVNTPVVQSPVASQPTPPQPVVQTPAVVQETPAQPVAQTPVVSQPTPQQTVVAQPQGGSQTPFIQTIVIPQSAPSPYPVMPMMMPQPAYPSYSQPVVQQPVVQQPVMTPQSVVQTPTQTVSVPVPQTNDANSVVIPEVYPSWASSNVDNAVPVANTPAVSSLDAPLTLSKPGVAGNVSCNPQDVLCLASYQQQGYVLNQSHQNEFAGSKEVNAPSDYPGEGRWKKSNNIPRW